MTETKLALMKQEPLENDPYIRLPRRVMTMGLSLAAKVIYALLLNRLELSRKNGWVNQEGEVYLIYSRQELAQAAEMGEKRVTSAMRELRQKELVWEIRRGLGRANRYVLGEVVGVQGFWGFVCYLCVLGG